MTLLDDLNFSAESNPMIDQLYTFFTVYGNCGRVTTVTNPLQTRMLEACKAFEETLTPEQAELYYTAMERSEELQSELLCERFIMGYKISAKILREATN